MPGRSPGEGYLSIMRCLPPLQQAFPSSPRSDPGPVRQTVHSAGKKQKVVLRTEVVAQLEQDRSRSVGFGVTVQLVGSSAASLPAKLRTRRFQLPQERFRLDGKMTMHDWRQSVGKSFQEEIRKLQIRAGQSSCMSLFFPQ